MTQPQDTARELPVWRSLLYVPVNVDKYVDRAHTRGADVIQLDLEDSVPPAEKAAARKLVAAAAAKVRRAGADVVVRINRPLSLAVRDLEHAVGPDVDGVACTKVDSASHLKLLDETVSEIEAARGMRIGHTHLLALVETAEAFSRMDEIARASSRLVGMSLGGEDFALACGMQPDDEVLLSPKQRMIVAARAAGIMPMGFIGSVASFGDWEPFRAMVRRSRRFGFDGASCIHPGQVAIVNEEYSPSPEDVDYARRIIALNDEAASTGRGSFALDGKMIDIPIIGRAQQLLRRHEAIVRRQAAARAAS